ncbi:MAG: hypothetical protein KatS3mg111_3997 [Pirellulaceae bacterium]|nr:MAG: hypothetical protein KatS3mg111_3997 [Pirellulaceae bacterium]
MTGVFLFFLFVLGIKWIDGEQRCDCLGSLSLPLGVMAAVDGMALVSLLLFRRSWERLWRGHGLVFDQIRNLHVVLPALLLGGIAWFGSLDAARSYLSGDPLVVDSFTKFAGEVKEGEFVDVPFRLHNPTSAPVDVLGAKASCSCVAILDLPTTVAPGGDKSIRLRVYGVRASTVQRERAELIFDADAALRMVLNVTVVVRPSSDISDDGSLDEGVQ